MTQQDALKLLDEQIKSTEDREQRVKLIKKKVKIITKVQNERN